MYKLTLTAGERKAIDWIGNRYAHGDDLYDLLIVCTQTCDAVDNGDDTWTGPHDITFEIPEVTAWIIKDMVDQNPSLDCFSSTLVDKFHRFSSAIT